LKAEAVRKLMQEHAHQVHRGAMVLVQPEIERRTFEAVHISEVNVEASIDFVCLVAEIYAGQSICECAAVPGAGKIGA
jgi:hypothetical protein